MANDVPHEANGHDPGGAIDAIALRPQLSDYEASQVEQIARWKSTEPSLLTQAVEMVAQPISWGVKRVVPSEVVRQAIHLLNRLADAKMRKSPEALAMARRALLTRRHQPLDVCDGLSVQVIRDAERLSAGRGLVIRQLGNAVIGRLPLQLVTAMATITKVGHCYGYPLDRPLDRAVLLDLLELALVEACSKRMDVLARMHAALDKPEATGLDVQEIAAAAGRDVLADELADELLSRIPLIGRMIGFIGDRTFVRVAGEGAMRFFQERRLRDEGKVTEILPSRTRFRRSSLSEVRRALGETIYAGGAIIGFVATLPVCAVGSLARRLGGPVVDGAAAGGMQAVEDVEQLWVGGQNFLDVAPVPILDVTPV